MIILFSVLIASIYLFIWLKQRSNLYILASKIPGPPVLPIFGNSLNILNHAGGPMQYLVQISKEYGPVTKYWIGSNLNAILTDPNDVEIVLKDTNNIKKSTKYDGLKPWLGNGLIVSTGDYWRHHRKCLTPAFHFNNVEKFVKVFKSQGKILVSNLSKHLDGEPFDVYPYIKMFTLDSIMETSMGQKNNAEQTKVDFVLALNRLLQITAIRMYNPLLHPNFIFKLTKLGREYKKTLDYLHNYGRNIMEDRRKELNGIDVNDLVKTDYLENKSRLAFLDLLLVNQKLGNGFSDSEVLFEINNFLFGGSDTTSAVLAFTIYNLAKYPEIQDKVYEEISELFGRDRRDLSLKDLQSAHYLEMVIKESMRLYPPVPIISRLLETDLKLTNYIIPAGTSLNCFIHMLMRNETCFPNLEKFEPERFSYENIKNRHSFAYLPFSAGLRNCVGQKYAMAQLKSTMIDILMDYNILYMEDIQGLELNIVLAPIGGVVISLEKRK